MYGLRSNTDLSFFRGAFLQQVCIGENEVILHFESDISIMVASKVNVVSVDGTAQSLEDPRKIGVTAVNFLGVRVRDASVRGQGTLRLVWAGGPALEISDSWPDYESYTIRHGEMVIVV